MKVEAAVYKRYKYEGPVVAVLSKQCIKDKWEAETSAVSEIKAKINIIWQFKKRYGLAKTFNITLPGKIKLI